MVRVGVVLWLWAWPGIAAHAQPEPYYGDPYRFWKWPAEDVAAVVQETSAQELALATGTLGVMLLLARHDGGITTTLAEQTPPGGDLLVRVVEEVGNVRAVRPVSALIFVGALMADAPRAQDAAFTSLEAVLLANLVTGGLKAAVGRARPWQGEGDATFRPFSGNTSFPSGHATTAFAFVTPWLLYYPNALTPGLLVLSTGTAFTRMLTRNHWFTDVVAGSAIGFTTAYWLTRRHQDHARRVLLAPALVGDRVGLSLQVTLGGD